MSVSERDMLDSAEYTVKLLERARHGKTGTSNNEILMWLDKARKIIKSRKDQYIDNGTPRRFGPDDPNPTR